ncbi:MAG: hypothetical protein RLZZ179_1081 [Verrucomicrobiota bacterium]|jgi:hypothetical protein
MKRSSFIPTILALAAAPILASAQEGAGAAGAAPAAAAAKEKLVDIAKVDINIQKTPQIQAINVKDKRWTPKDWIEIEVEATAELSKTEKDKTRKAYDEVTFEYFAYLAGATKEKSRVLTAKIIHTNVPIKEKIHSVAYISPPQLQKVTDSTASGPANPTMVKAWGVQVYIDGNLVGRKTSEANKEWWTNPSLPPQEAALLSKPETPFAPLWGDFHLEVKPR